MHLKSIAILVLSFTISIPTLATEAASAPSDTVFQRTTNRGVAFLRKMQNPDGSYASELGPGVTAIVATSLLRNGISEKDPAVARALAYLERFIQDDGGIYQPESIYRNYETSLAVMCFAETEQERFEDIIARAQRFLKKIQWDDEEGHGLSSPSYGGAGYGKHKRPDLSNTAFFVEALKASGLDADDEAMKRAAIFISRCQNQESEHNTLPFSTKVGDGGFYYTGAAGGSSQAGLTENQGLRSYGSMTYAGLKSMIYAGVKKDDPRVKAAVEWISKNYDLSRNPGMRSPNDGLYYYYHTFAKALDALGRDTLEDNAGNAHDWRAELIAELAKRQQPNGSWVNESQRWLEGESQLVTAYALLSLSYCK